MSINSSLMEAFEYSPILIETMSHSINIPEGILVEDLIGKVTGRKHYKASYNLDESTLIINVRTELYYHDNFNERILLFHIEVRNGYQIKNLSDFITDDAGTIEPRLLEYLKSVSVAQTRGVQSTITHNTPLASMLIPPMRST